MFLPRPCHGCTKTNNPLLLNNYSFHSCLPSPIPCLSPASQKFLRHPDPKLPYLMTALNLGLVSPSACASPESPCQLPSPSLGEDHPSLLPFPKCLPFLGCSGLSCCSKLMGLTLLAYRCIPGSFYLLGFISQAINCFPKMRGGEVNELFLC